VNSRILLISLMVAAPSTAGAGHGLMSAFGDVERLPNPGRTPDQIAYVFDRWEEHARLALASTATARYILSLQFAREKLAEIESLVRRNIIVSTHVAIAAYTEYIGIAAREIATLDKQTQRNFDQQYAIALLEHQYVMSVNYLDLPRDSRRLISEVIDAASAQYELISPRLDDAFKATLFFKLDEVRWSWEVAQQADKQGL